MSKIMNCETGKNLMDDYLGGSLDKGTRLALEDHLEHCASCQAHFAQEQAFRQRLQSQLVAQPKAGFADRVLERAVEHHQNKARHHWSFIGGAIAASVIIAVTSFALRFGLQQSDMPRQTLALHQVTRVALAMDSREELKGATITLQLPDNVELKGFPGQHLISWKTDIDRGTNLLALPVMAVAEKNGLLVARLEHGNKSKEFKVELSVRNRDVNGGLDFNHSGDEGSAGSKRGNA